MKGETLYLSFRQREILLLILSKHGPVTLRSLTEQYQLSEKSIHNDLKIIAQWLDKRKVALHSENGTVIPVVSEQQRITLQNELKRESGPADFMEKDERVRYITDLLLFSDAPVTSSVLCEKLMVSKPTVMSDLETVKEYLDRRHLVLLRKKGKGYWIGGEENRLRETAEQRLISLLKTRHIYTVGQLFHYCDKPEKGGRDPLERFLAKADCRPVMELMECLHGKVCLELTEENGLCLAAAVLVIIWRTTANQQVTEPLFSEEVLAGEGPMMALAGLTFSIIGKYYRVSYNLCELQYLVYKFYQYGVHLVNEGESQRPGLQRTVDEMLEQLYRLMGTEGKLPEDEARLHRTVYDYLSFVLHRKKLRIASYNPLYTRIKAAYPQLYLAVERLLQGDPVTREADEMKRKGIAASDGYAVGPAFCLKKRESTHARQSALTPAEEMKRMEKAVAQAAAGLDEAYAQALEKLGPDEAGIFQMHAMLLQEEEFLGEAKAQIEAGATAEYAVQKAGSALAQEFAALDDDYMKARAADFEDITVNVVRHLDGSAGEAFPDEPVILVAEDLTPNQLLSFSGKKLLAIVTRKGSIMSHASILARNLGIPAVVGVAEFPEEYKGDLIVDGAAGEVYTEPAPEQLADYRARIAQQEEDRARRRHQRPPG